MAEALQQAASWSQIKHRPAARSNVINPIRQILEKELRPDPNHEKPHLGLGLGEPSRANGFELPPVINQAIIEAVESEKHNGYTQSTGTQAARAAVA